jgi:hypothetical protein
MRRAAALCALLAACSSNGGSTPEDTFGKAKTALGKKDWRGLFGVIDADAGDLLLLDAVLFASSAMKGDPSTEKDLHDLANRHGLAEPRFVRTSTRKEMARDMFKELKDKPGLFADLMTCFETHGKQMRSVMLALENASLRNVKFDGDGASATLEGAGDEEGSVMFIRRDGRWYFSTVD